MSHAPKYDGELNLDLRMDTLMRACKGNVKALPSFMVHSDAVWPTFRRTQLDSKNRIHMRRSTFYQAVSSQLPMRAGIWHGIDVQEFHIDLQPHHLQGSSDMQDPKGYKHSRLITKTDDLGRNPWDFDYGYTPRRIDPAEVEPGLAISQLKAPGPRRSVRSTVFDGIDAEGE